MLEPFGMRSLTAKVTVKTPHFLQELLDACSLIVLGCDQLLWSWASWLHYSPATFPLHSLISMVHDDCFLRDKGTHVFRSREEAYRSPIELQPCRSPDTWKLFFLSSCVGNEGIHISYSLRSCSGIIVLARGRMVSGTVNQAYSQELCRTGCLLHQYFWVVTNPEIVGNRKFEEIMG